MKVWVQENKGGFFKELSLNVISYFNENLVTVVGNIVLSTKLHHLLLFKIRVNLLAKFDLFMRARVWKIKACLYKIIQCLTKMCHF